MVKRVKKNGIYTSSSMKLGLNKFRMRNYKKDQCVLTKYYDKPFNGLNADYKNRHAQEKCQDVINDGGLGCSNEIYGHWGAVMTYSLNKRKRWDLPKIIKNAIDEIHQGDECAGDIKTHQFNVGLTERKVSPIGAHEDGNVTYYVGSYTRLPDSCTGYHDSRLENPHVLPTKTFSYASDLEKKHEATGVEQSGKRSRRTQHDRGVQRRFTREKISAGKRRIRRRRRIALPIDEEDDQPITMYEISQPHGLLGIRQEYALDHKFTFGTEDNSIGRRLRNKSHFNKSWNKRSAIYARGRRDLNNKINDGYMSLFEEDYAMEETSDYLCENSGMEILKNPFTLLDYISDSTTHTKSSGKKKESRYKMNKDETTVKKQLVFVDKLEEPWVMVESKKLEKTEGGASSAAFQTMDSYNFTSKYETLSDTFVRVYIQKESLEEKNLISVYKDAYDEGLSSPRRFSIQLDTFRYNPRISFTNQCWVVCETVQTDGDGNCDNGSTLVNLKIKCSNPTEDVSELYANLEERFTKKDHTIQDFIQIIKLELNLLTAGENSKPFVQRKPVKFKKFSLIERRQDCSCQIYTRGAALFALQDEPIEIKIAPTRRWHSVTSVGESACHTLERHCDICLDSVEVDDQSQNGMALKQCKHWFCNECWRNHIQEKTTQRDLTIRCPDFGCDDAVDQVNLRYFLTHAAYIKYQTHLQNVKLEMSKRWKWCPNVLCSRAVKMTVITGGARNVECDCGQGWCFTCQGEAHWPATCERANRFINTIKERGDDNNANLTCHVKVKRCPACHYPMQKNGGCPSMVCFQCKQSFCWTCLKLFSQHDPMNCSRNVKESVIAVNHENDVITNGLRFYYSGLRHRRVLRNWSDSLAMKRTINAASYLTRRFRKYIYKIGDHTLAPVFESEAMYSPGHHYKQLIDKLVECQTCRTYKFEEVLHYLTSLTAFVKQVHYILQYVYVGIGRGKQKNARTYVQKAEYLEAVLCNLKRFLQTKHWDSHQVKETMIMAKYGRIVVETILNKAGNIHE